MMMTMIPKTKLLIGLTHCANDVDPGCGVILPAGHWIQIALCAVSLYDDTGQIVHATLPNKKG